MQFVVHVTNVNIFVFSMLFCHLAVAVCQSDIQSQMNVLLVVCEKPSFRFLGFFYGIVCKWSAIYLVISANKVVVVVVM